ncbi:MAG: F0F1 ATP synthase subunit B [Thermodesulfovibrionales bacterium]
MMKVQNSGFKVISKVFLVFTLCLLNLLLAVTVFASEEGAEAHTSLFKDYLWKIINFGILAFILFKFGRKPLQSFLKQRAELIEKTLKEAQQAKEAAQKALQEVEERLKTKDKEIEDIISASRRSGEEARESLIQQGDRLKEKILEQARVNIEYELKSAKEAIKAEAVEIAMELAEKKLKERLTKEEQKRLLEESLAKIGGRG